MTIFNLGTAHSLTLQQNFNVLTRSNQSVQLSWIKKLWVALLYILPSLKKNCEKSISNVQDSALNLRYPLSGLHNFSQTNETD